VEPVVDVGQLVDLAGVQHGREYEIASDHHLRGVEPVPRRRRASHVRVPQRRTCSSLCVATTCYYPSDESRVARSRVKALPHGLYLAVKSLHELDAVVPSVALKPETSCGCFRSVSHLQAHLRNRKGRAEV
jgi:hypothetical protein